MTRPWRMLARIAHLGAALLLGACGPQVQAANWTGVVTHVTDGDTFWVRPDDGQSPPRKVRLEGIDAPEICQPHGDDAAQALARRVLRQPVHLATRATDDYHRTLARVTVKGEDVGAWMVAQGHAWSYRYRRNPGPYAKEEAAARRSRRGLFADARPLRPGEFRQRYGSCHVN